MLHRSCIGGLALLTLVGPGVAQHDLETLVAQLGEPAQRARAVERLVAFGEACVPALSPLLLRCGTNHEVPATQLAAALTVLAELGPRASDATKAIEHAYRYAPNAEVRNAALDAIDALAPALDERRRFDLAQMLQGYTSPAQDETRRWSTAMLLRLGPDCEEQVLDQFLREGGYGGVAAARVAHAQPTLPDTLRRTLVDTLARGLRRSSLPWLSNPQEVLPTGDAARALVRHGTPAREVARGLLQCREPELRRLGLENLGEPSRWTPAERFDVVRLMWDPDRVTRELAVATLTALDADGLMALRPLRAFEAWERGQGRGKRADFFARCAARLVAAAAARGEPAGELMRRADLLLQGRELPAELPPLVCDAAARALLADVVRGCLGADDEAPRRLATLARAAGALPLREGDDALRDAFLSLLQSDGEAARMACFRALVAIGPSLADGDPERFARLLFESNAANITQPWSAEAMVLAGPAADVADLHEALRSARWHVAVRAAVELLERNALDESDRPALRALLGAEEAKSTMSTDLTYSQLTGLPRRYHYTLVPFRCVRSIAALASTALGDQPWQDAQITYSLAYTVDWLEDGPEVERSLRAARADGTLKDLARRVEQDCWHRHGWPRLR
ncbi:MAG: hypothetical protein R3F29_05630 [Planctomycetota bacterium]